ncbi:uncharacterized protein LOC123441833 [Hordeum vulgare subsp. vulgare]|uniref:Uncharacterized protein n=1 Tax=Hordeum vulgare subsp. vulgare TaxID=112509 RepID=A0A8I6X2K7_HORVV|nr:uncharacterized protein LOC123441833 [Hordeum vulgare subsp. vulgare]KAI4999841.1 hypothetical protein ZWY2020_004430 [Hordeum vulgare]
MAAAEQEADARKKPAAGKRWDGARGRDRDASPAAPREDAGKEGALAECAVSCCVFCACLPVAVLCCVARAPVRAARRCWRLRRRRPARRLAPGGSSSFSDAELGDLRQGRVRTMADEDGSPPPPPPPRQPPPRDREEDRRR